MFINKKGGGGRVVSAAYKKWHEAACRELIEQRLGRIEGGYALAVLARPPSIKRKRDIDNIVKAINDLLVSVTLVEDDSLAAFIAATWADLPEPGVAVLVTSTNFEMGLSAALDHLNRHSLAGGREQRTRVR